MLYDKSPEQVDKGLRLMDKLLAKDVAKGKIVQTEADEARSRISVVPHDKGIIGMRDVDMVIEVIYFATDVFRAYLPVVLRFNFLGRIRKPRFEKQNIR